MTSRDKMIVREAAEQWWSDYFQLQGPKSLPPPPEIDFDDLFRHTSQRLAEHVAEVQAASQNAAKEIKRKEDREMNEDQFPKMTSAILALSTQAHTAAETNFPAAKMLVADCERALKRLAEKAAPLPVNFEQMTITQDRGPTLSFSGKLLADREFETDSENPMRVTLEIWETVGGALVAVKETEPMSGNGVVIVKASVVPAQDDQQAMHIAIMRALDWSIPARGMTKDLGWNLMVEVA